jgi:16S rRNA (guanine527-N7)-methyltransferase
VTRDALDAVLADAVRLHFLSARPRLGHREHAMAFVAELDGVAELEGSEGHIVDLGAGGGVPGLVVACELAPQPVVCVERRARRAAFLRLAVSRLALTNVVVEGVAAEDLVAEGRWRGAAAVIARGFGPPERTAAVAAGLVTDGGLVVVSEPPADWPPTGAPATSELGGAHGIETASAVPSPGRPEQVWLTAARRWGSASSLGLHLEAVREGPPALVRLRRDRGCST